MRSPCLLPSLASPVDAGCSADECQAMVPALCSSMGSTTQKSTEMAMEWHSS